MGFSGFRNSWSEMFCKTYVLKNFAKFIGKHLRQSLFLLKKGPQLYLKKDPGQVLFSEFCKIFMNVFFCRTPPTTAFLGCGRG